MTRTTTRRAMLASVATTALAVPALAGISGLPSDDPIFPAIEAHRRAVVAADARGDEHTPNYEKHVGCYLADTSREISDADRAAMMAGIDHPEFVATSAAWGAACDTAQEAARVLAFTEPTTLAGLAAAMIYLADHMAALDDAPEDDTLLDDGYFSAVFAFTLSEAAQMLATA